MKWVAAFTILFGVLVLAGCGQKPPAEGKVGLEFNDRCYRIPEWSARFINGSAGFPFFESRESTRSLRLRFSNAEIRERIPGFELPLMVNGQLLEGTLVSLYVPSPDELAQIRKNEVLRQPEFYGAWYAENGWEQRTIEPSPVPGLFRVSFIPNANSWFVVTRMPDMKARDTHLAKDFWISSCYVTEGANRTTCSFKVEQDGIFIDSDSPESNLPYREQMGRFFLDKLDTWKVACGADA